MQILIIRDTVLYAQPALTSEILHELRLNAYVTGIELSGDWIRVSVFWDNGMIEGWVLAKDCRQVPDPRDRASEIKELAAKRREAVATPVGAPKPPALERGFDDRSRLGIDALKPDDNDGDSREAPRKRRRVLRGPVTRSEPPIATPANAPALSPQAAADVIDISVFAPQSLRAGGECLVQVFLHMPDQDAAVAAQASETDAASGRRGVKTLATEIARGTRVQIVFEGRGLAVDQAMQELTWRGQPDACQFTAAAPADAAGKTFYPRILVLLNSVPVGTVTFALPAIIDAPAQATMIRGDEARRYSYAFLSYSSHDRAEVLKRAQGLKAGRIDFFQDLLSLEPGEQWAQRLYQEIDRCDLFLLFWSSQAKASPWVMKEVEYALARRKSSSDGLPDITPVIIEGPPPPAAPDSLKDIHFNDSLIYVLAAVEAQGQSPKPQ
jgi:TIR domain